MRRRRVKSRDDRFWDKVNLDGPVIRDDLGPCAVFTGSNDKPDGTGYGKIRTGRRGEPIERAHRFAYLLVHGRIPVDGDGNSLLLLHACDWKPCVKCWEDERGPAHVGTGTYSQNLREAWERVRKSLTVAKM